MLRATAGQILVNEALPEDLRDYSRVLDKKGLTELLRAVAERHPDSYRDVSFRLLQLGRDAAHQTGGMTFGLRHLRKSESAKRIRDELQRTLSGIYARPGQSREDRRKAVIEAVGAVSDRQQKEVLDEALRTANPLAVQVLSGTRGNAANLNALVGSPLLFADYRDRSLPVPILRSYSEGLRPWEYWASAYGARKGVIATKFATADAGYLGKQLNQIAHRLVVTDLDGDGEPDLTRGFPVDADDPDNEGAFLARQTGPYRRNTVLTPKILKHLQRLGQTRILVRSPITGNAPDGVYARDVGLRERGLPARGDLVGMTAAQALAEPLSQGQLSAKHSGGMVGTEKAVSGFAAIDQQIQAPHRLQGGTAHAQRDGRVGRIETAPVGGHYVHVDGERHYLPDGSDPLVKPGDEVEAGDVLGTGWPNPAEIVRHKGLGEGRRYLVQSLRDAFRSARLPVHRRNLELLARGLVDRVRLTDEYDVHVPDDVVPYGAIEAGWEPREGSRRADPSASLGKYLERPVLHYTIGTKIRPSVQRELRHFGIDQVHVHDDPPPFEPHFVRGMDFLQTDPDWMTRMYGGGLKKGLLGAVQRGSTSDEEGTSFVPSLARSVDFGRRGPVAGPRPFDMELSLDEPETPPAPRLGKTAADNPYDVSGGGQGGNPYSVNRGPAASGTRPDVGGAAGAAALGSSLAPQAWQTISGGRHWNRFAGGTGGLPGLGRGLPGGFGLPVPGHGSGQPGGGGRGAESAFPAGTGGGAAGGGSDGDWTKTVAHLAAPTVLSHASRLRGRPLGFGVPTMAVEGALEVGRNAEHLRGSLDAAYNAPTELKPLPTDSPAQRESKIQQMRGYYAEKAPPSFRDLEQQDAVRQFQSPDRWWTPYTQAIPNLSDPRKYGWMLAPVMDAPVPGLDRSLSEAIYGEGQHMGVTGADPRLEEQRKRQAWSNVQPDQQWRVDLEDPTADFNLDVRGQQQRAQVEEHNARVLADRRQRMEASRQALRRLQTEPGMPPEERAALLREHGDVLRTRGGIDAENLRQFVPTRQDWLSRRVGDVQDALPDPAEMPWAYVGAVPTLVEGLRRQAAKPVQAPPVDMRRQHAILPQNVPDAYFHPDWTPPRGFYGLRSGVRPDLVPEQLRQDDPIWMDMQGLRQEYEALQSADAAAEAQRKRTFLGPAKPVSVLAPPPAEPPPRLFERMQPPRPAPADRVSAEDLQLLQEFAAGR